MHETFSTLYALRFTADLHMKCARMHIYVCVHVHVHAYALRFTADLTRRVELETSGPPSPGPPH